MDKPVLCWTDVIKCGHILFEGLLWGTVGIYFPLVSVNPVPHLAHSSQT